MLTIAGGIILAVLFLALLPFIAVVGFWVLLGALVIGAILLAFAFPPVGGILLGLFLIVGIARGIEEFKRWTAKQAYERGASRRRAKEEAERRAAHAIEEAHAREEEAAEQAEALRRQAERDAAASPEGRARRAATEEEWKRKRAEQAILAAERSGKFCWTCRGHGCGECGGRGYMPGDGSCEGSQEPIPGLKPGDVVACLHCGRNVRLTAPPMPEVPDKYRGAKEARMIPHASHLTLA